MKPFRLPNEDEIRAPYRQGEEAVVVLFYETFSKLADRMQRMEDQIANNSNNRGKPTYYTVHQNRGGKALDVIGIFPVFKGTAVHDAYRSYFLGSTTACVMPTIYAK